MEKPVPSQFHYTAADYVVNEPTSWGKHHVCQTRHDVNANVRRSAVDQPNRQNSLATFSPET
jgi:hypothetical protein